MRRGFTTVELLIVGVFLAITSAAMLSKWANGPDDPRKQLLQYNLTKLRSQIEHYKLEHGGAPPQVVDGALPQLTAATDQEGRIGPAGPNHPLGPYFPGPLPGNPLDGRSAVAPAIGYPFATATPEGGWLYEVQTGKVAPNAPGHLDD